LIALLNKEFRWNTNESAVTGKLYTRRNKFVRTQPDRSTNRPVTWSLKLAGVRARGTQRALKIYRALARGSKSRRERRALEAGRW
jgi:hypothetical protein